MSDDHATMMIKSAGDGDFDTGIERLVKAARDAGYLTPEQDAWLTAHPGRLLPARGDLTEVLQVEQTPAARLPIPERRVFRPARKSIEPALGWDDWQAELNGEAQPRQRQRVMRGAR